ncbi:type II toxin-antitoxin system prevent-host-death family antitoxin [Paraburkholderia phymatum]|uniref:Type II toxin-antitoxin system prevent-host-death family antitoxin n=1 Tax=Paraburkholderia phymatum TaxID=148447 RepID=A0ACC6U7Z8_9BURK
MIKKNAFSLAYLRAHADELVAAVHGSNSVIVITDNGVPKAALQDVRSCEY